MVFQYNEFNKWRYTGCPDKFYNVDNYLYIHTVYGNNWYAYIRSRRHNSNSDRANTR